MPCSHRTSFAIAAALASALSASCTDSHLKAGGGAGGGGGGDLAASCYAAGLSEPPITCPEGCYEITGRYAEGCWPSVEDPHGVVGCRPDLPGGVGWIETCFVRERDGGLPLVVAIPHTEDSMGKQAYASCFATGEEIPECPSAP